MSTHAGFKRKHETMEAAVVPITTDRRAKLQSDTTTVIPTLSFYRPDALPVAPPTVSKQVKVKSTMLHKKA